ncbi:hypothetical protein M407DRAFT_246750 [Tulasnella calospora MUT 4182]|uniref:BTB domain-containing protein n=1 Tax=Tulasnella calospora MUT 4182 TaxID=1051891 RepID=A0A0C3PRW5_9AGAM|nr:hypothetical protein M407DRAFT_246750 [Tulasnella calospora MUT 4182]
MPPGDGKRPNGETDDDPVVLPSSVVTVERFELFLAWLYQDREVPASLHEASTLLHLADYLDVPHLLKRMSAYVLALPSDSLPPAERIYLHRRYHLSDKQWLSDAFSNILEGSFAKLTIADLALLGIPTVHRLIPIFAKLERHRTTLAVKPPPATHETDCKDHDKCEVSWITFWANRISPLLLSETSPASGLKITRNLSTWSVSPWAAGMNYSCLWATANGVSALTNIITADQSFIVTAVSDLVDFHDW